ANGAYSYTPPAALPEGGTLTEVFNYTITDADGDTSSTTLTITVDRLPLAVADVNSAVEGGAAVSGNVIATGPGIDDEGNTSATVTAASQVGNGNALTIGSAFATTAGGSLTLNANGAYSYTPPAALPEGGTLTEVFNYTITDADGDTSSTTLTITVDRLPLAVADTATTPAGGPAATGNVITNDDEGNVSATVTSSAQGASPLTLGTPFATAGGGSLTLQANGNFSYTPPGVIPAAGLVEIFAYTITDADGDTSASTLTITVTGAPNIAATKADALQIDADASTDATPGDTLRYTVVITNSGNQDAAAVLFTDLVADTTLAFVSGSVTTTLGAVTTGNTGGDTTVLVTLGTLVGGGGSATITFDVTIDTPLPLGVTVVANQGTVSGTNFPDRPTDDPGTGAGPDPTVTPVTASPIITSTKSDSLQVDADGSGNVSPGDTVRYTVVVSNTGNQEATSVQFADPVADANYAFLVGSVTKSQGSVTTGNTAGDTTVLVNLGSVGAGSNATVTFDVVIDTPLPAGVTQVANQGTVSGGNFTDKPTDDPSEPGVDDPTVTPVTAAPDLVVSKTDNDLAAAPGDTQTYTITITNVGNQAATGIVVTDTYLTTVLTNAQSTDGGNTATPGIVTWNIASLAGGGASVTRTFTVDVIAPALAGIENFTNNVEVHDDGTNGVDPTPNTASDTDTLVAAPDLQVSKTDNDLAAAPGDT
ncbi:MAG: DUF11 domain-containing protein, partial [Acidobacteria bacterium]|nr:DUF11 domain-containing protein [Acidobacteriota bacterium]